MQQVYGKECVAISASILQVRLLEFQRGLGLSLRKLCCLCYDRLRACNTQRVVVRQILRKVFWSCHVHAVDSLSNGSNLKGFCFFCCAQGGHRPKNLRIRPGRPRGTQTAKKWKTSQKNWPKTNGENFNSLSKFESVIRMKYESKSRNTETVSCRQCAATRYSFIHKCQNSFTGKNVSLQACMSMFSDVSWYVSN